MDTNSRRKEVLYTAMPPAFWWIRQIALILAGIFFLVFGIYLLLAAYQLKDPFNFIMTFFASNLIILISAVLLLGFVLQAIRTARATDEEPLK